MRNEPTVQWITPKNPKYDHTVVCSNYNFIGRIRNKTGLERMLDAFNLKQNKEWERINKFNEQYPNL